LGARTTRITREDLLSHPAFEDIPQSGDETGQVGGARIELVRSGDETCMWSCYQQIPLRVLPSFAFENEPACLLYLITLTTGFLDGDGHVMDLRARPGTRAVVTGQSAARIHPAVSSFATQQWTVDLEEDAWVVALPGVTIPYRGSRYYQRGRVTMAPGSRLIWGDIWLPGRYDRGNLSERFVFDRLVQDFEVRREDRLVYRDCFQWNGPWTPEQIQWYVGEHLASASLFVGGPLPESLGKPDPHVCRSVFPLESGDTCIRWCGHPMQVTADLVNVALSIAGVWTGGQGAAPWLLASTELSPNHWFTPIQSASES
jgi:urease accessory protein